MVRVLNEESVLLNLETERYFGLDETGTRMWQLAVTAPCLQHAYEQLLSEFDVESERLRADFSDLLDRLVESGLLTVVAGDVGAAPAV